jgi:hypothetical protein
MPVYHYPLAIFFISLLYIFVSRSNSFRMIPQRVPRMTRSLLVRHQLRSAFQSSASQAAALTSQDSNTAGAGRGRNINASVNASKLKLCPRSENFSEW